MTCNECFHCSVCPFADGIEYANEEFIKLDCEHFINTANVAPIADTVRKMQEQIKALFAPDDDVQGEIDKIAKVLEGEK